MPPTSGRSWTQAPLRSHVRGFLRPARHRGQARCGAVRHPRRAGAASTPPAKADPPTNHLALIFATLSHPSRQLSFSVSRPLGDSHPHFTLTQALRSDSREGPLTRRPLGVLAHLCGPRRQIGMLPTCAPEGTNAKSIEMLGFRALQSLQDHSERRPRPFPGPPTLAALARRSDTLRS